MRRPLQGNPSHTSYRYANGLWNVQRRLAASGHPMPCSGCALHGLGCFVTANRSGQAAETGDGVWEGWERGVVDCIWVLLSLGEEVLFYYVGVLRGHRGGGGGGGVMRSTCVVLSCPASVPPPAVLVSAAGRAGCCCMRLGCASPVQPPRCRTLLSAAGEVHRWCLPPWCAAAVVTPVQPGSVCTPPRRATAERTASRMLTFY
jgi:hypothetical protein